MSRAVASIEFEQVDLVPVRFVHWFARTIRVVCISAFGLVAFLTAALAIASSASADSSLSLLGREVLIVKSGSMSPALRTGDAVVVKTIDQRDAVALSVGEIVTFKSAENPKLLVTHRIVEVRRSTKITPIFVTKGDANQSPDVTPLRTDQMVGVVTRRLPRVGFVLYSLQRPAVLVAYMVAVVLAQIAVVTTSRTVSSPIERDTHEKTKK